MSYKAFRNLKEIAELEFINDMEPKQINDIFNQLKLDVDMLQAENEKLKAERDELSILIANAAIIAAHPPKDNAILAALCGNGLKAETLVEILKLEQQAKGVDDFIKSIDPYISRGESWILRFDDVIADEYLEQLRQQASELTPTQED